MRAFPLIAPWVLAALLAGLLIGEYRVRLTAERLWGARHQEATVRQDVSDRALTLATENKFVTRDKKMEAIRQLRKEGGL